jgi:hypothetical protein
MFRPIVITLLILTETISFLLYMCVCVVSESLFLVWSENPPQWQLLGLYESADLFANSDGASSLEARYSDAVDEHSKNSHFDNYITYNNQPLMRIRLQIFICLLHHCYCLRFISDCLEQFLTCSFSTAMAGTHRPLPLLLASPPSLLHTDFNVTWRRPH